MKQWSLWRAASIAALLVFILLLLSVFPSSPNTAEDTTSLLRRLLLDNVRRQRPVQALYQAEALAAQTGWTADLLRTAGEMAYTLGDYERAAGYWQIIPENGKTASLLRQLAGVYYQRQDWDSFAAAVEQLLALAPDDAWAHYSQGWMLAVTQPQAALRHLQAAARDPLYRDQAVELLAVIQTAVTQVPMRVGITLAQHDRWPEAEFAFKQAAAADGPVAEALAYAAVARDQQGKDGQPDMRQAVELAPQNALVRFLQGLHLRLAHDIPGSLEAFKLAAALNPVNPAYAAELGTAYQMNDDLTRAEYWLKRAVTLSGSDPRFQQLLDAFHNQTFPN